MLTKKRMGRLQARAKRAARALSNHAAACATCHAALIAGASAAADCAEGSTLGAEWNAAVDALPMLHPPRYLPPPSRSKDTRETERASGRA